MATPPPSDPTTAYPAVTRGVRQAEQRHARLSAPLERAVAYGQLLQVLGELVGEVTAERDAALVEVLGEDGHPSHRKLAHDLGLSRQRVDQLAAIVVRGGTPRREPR